MTNAGLRRGKLNLQIDKHRLIVIIVTTTLIIEKMVKVEGLFDKVTEDKVPIVPKVLEEILVVNSGLISHRNSK